MWCIFNLIDNWLLVNELSVLVFCPFNILQWMNIFIVSISEDNLDMLTFGTNLQTVLYIIYFVYNLLVLSIYCNTEQSYLSYRKWGIHVFLDACFLFYCNFIQEFSLNEEVGVYICESWGHSAHQFFFLFCYILLDRKHIKQFSNGCLIWKLFLYGCLI